MFDPCIGYGVKGNRVPQRAVCSRLQLHRWITVETFSLGFTIVGW